MKQTIILASDHAGFAVKEAVKTFLQGKGYEIRDVGASTFVDGDDYPEYMMKAGMEISKDLKNESKAIIFGGSGEGEAIVANRFPGVRAVVWYGGDKAILKLTREHNDANVLSIGARFVDEESAKEAVILWLKTPFSGEERHMRRIAQIDNFE